MQATDLQYLSTWFDNYIRPFFGQDQAMDQHMRLKVLHTRRVQQHCRRIAQALRLPAELALLAEGSGLLHDLGRFEQFQCYRTFSDAHSTDHGLLGGKIIHQTGLLQSFDSADKAALLQGVVCHNRRQLPPHWTKETRLVPAIVRDADKLDIYDLITGHIAEDKMIPSFELQQTLSWSPALGEKILQDRMPAYEDVKTAGDQMLFRAAWIFDLNFPASCRYVLERDHLGRLLQGLPGSPQLAAVYEHLLRRLLSQADPPPQ